MNAEAFLSGLHARGLQISLDIDSETGAERLKLAGQRERVTDRMRSYIKLHKPELCTILSQPRCTNCYHLVVEKDSSTWRMSEQGDLYCVPCWRRANDPHIEQAALFAEHVINNLDFKIFGKMSMEVSSRETGQVVYRNRE